MLGLPRQMPYVWQADKTAALNIHLSYCAQQDFVSVVNGQMFKWTVLALSV